MWFSCGDSPIEKTSYRPVVNATSAAVNFSLHLRWHRAHYPKVLGSNPGNEISEPIRLDSRIRRNKLGKLNCLVSACFSLDYLQQAEV